MGFSQGAVQQGLREEHVGQAEEGRHYWAGALTIDGRWEGGGCEGVEQKDGAHFCPSLPAPITAQDAALDFHPGKKSARGR